MAHIWPICISRCASSPRRFIGPGYREDTRGWINPSEFIAKHRGAPDDDVGRPSLD